MSRLFGRDWNVTIGDVDVSDLACDFRVKKTLIAQPNTAELVVRNLSTATRAKLTTPRRIGVRIEAGYVGSISQIYLGEVRSVSPGSVDGPDTICELTSADSELAMQVGRLSVPVGAGAAPSTVLGAIVRALGVDAGNVSDVAGRLAKEGRLVWRRDTVLVGNAARIATDVCRMCGCEWSIQDGAMQILDLSTPLKVHPYILSSDSGLVGSPKVDQHGIVSASALMLPNLRPGMPVQFDAKFVKGTYRVIECNYQGSTWGDAGAPWGIDIRCDRPIPFKKATFG